MRWSLRVVQDPLLAWRNTETLRRLAYLVERRQGGGVTSAVDPGASRSMDFEGLRIEYDDRVLEPAALDGRGSRGGPPS